MKSIGGYFELELPKSEEYHKNAIRLNTGRNAFEYILRAKLYKKVYLPYYTCDVMLEPLVKLNIPHEFYSIQSNFEPIINYSKVKKDEVFVYTNYFGICDLIAKKVSLQGVNLIVDNSQSFFSMPLLNVDTFYSARKFFGVPDGAYLYTDKLLDDIFDKDISYHRFDHLLGRIDIGVEQFYYNYKQNDEDLMGQSIKIMSNLSFKLLTSIDYNLNASLRRSNFNFLHFHLKDTNRLKFLTDTDFTPMLYPFLVDKGYELKKYLIENKIYTATYWPNVDKWVSRKSVEMNLINNLVCIPIDQRYDKNDMLVIINLILKYG